jgi:hypothetical protein
VIFRVAQRRPETWTKLSAERENRWASCHPESGRHEKQAGELIVLHRLPLRR